jgi:hypothetical protein
MALSANEVRILVTAQDAASKNLNAVGKAVGTLAKAAIGLGAAFASFKTLEGAISATQELGGAVNKLARETGLTAEASSQLLFAFRQVGLDAGDASTSIGIFAKKLKGIADEETGVTTGGKAIAQILRDVGIQATDAAGNIKPLADLLPALADRFKAMPDGLEKSALAMQLFGRSGKDMIPLLNQGSTGLKELAAEADRLGVTLTGANVGAIRAFTAAQRDMQEAISGLKVQIGLALMPILTELIQWFVDVQPEARQFLDEVIKKFRAVADAAEPFINAAKKLISVFGGLGVDLGDLILVLSATAAAFVALNFAADAVDLAVLIVQTIQLQMALATTTTVMASLKAAMMSLPGILIAVTVAFIAVDAIMKKIIGYGLIDWITGAGAAAKREAAFLKEYGDNLSRIDALMRAGATEEQARVIRLAELAKNTNALVAETQQLAKADALGYGHAIEYKEGLELLGQQFIGLKLSYGEWVAVLKKVPALSSIKAVTDAVEEARGAFINVTLAQQLSFPKELIQRIFSMAGALDVVADSAANVSSALEEVNKVTSDLSNSILPALEASLGRLALDRQINELETLKIKLGDAFGPERQAELDNLTRRASLMDNVLKTLALQFKAVGMKLAEAFGSEAKAKLQVIADYLAGLPAQQVIEILPILDVLTAVQIVNFINALKAGVTVPVAFAVAKFAIPAAALPILKLVGLDKVLGQLGGVALAAEKLRSPLENLNGGLGAIASSAGGAAEAAAAVQEAIDILEDGMISLAEANEKGIPAWAAARFEMAALAKTLQEQLAEQAWEAQKGLITLADAMGKSGVTGAVLSFWLAAQKANAGTLTLTDAINLSLTPAQAATIQGIADTVKAQQALKDSIYAVMVQTATFNEQLGGLPGSVSESVRQLRDLGMAIGSEGLGRAALDFQLAMQAVNTSFGSALAAATDFARGIATQVVSQLQGALGQLLGGPTVETANLQLQIDTLEYQKAVMAAAGATAEQTKAIDDQITALQNQLAVYTADHRVMQDRATLADQTLPTERQLKDMVGQITDNIRIYSGKVLDLTTATYLQVVSTGYAKDQAQRLGDVAKGFADYQFWLGTRIGDAAEVEIGAHYAAAAAAGHLADVLNSIQAPSGYQMGTPFVPATGIYQLHRGEAVLTAAEAKRRGKGEGSSHWANYGRLEFHYHGADGARLMREQARQLRGF